MYPNLNGEIAKRGLILEDLAKEMGCTIGTISNKLRGVSPVTLVEAKKLKKIVKSDLPLEELFSTEAI